VSCSPRFDLTTVLVVPESNMAAVIASSIALASSCLYSRNTFQRSSRRAHRCADVVMGLGLTSVTVRDRLLQGGGSSPEVTR
jgi:3-dehydroquinate dehydratase